MRNFGALAALLPLVAAAPSGLSTRGDTGCTSVSLDDFEWSLEDFTYSASYLFTTPAHQVSGGTVSFNLSNPALPETVKCTAYSTWLSDFFYGNINYDCVANDGSSTKTSFAYSYPAHQLAINQTWTCTDQDPKYPATFTGRGSVDLPLECKEDKWQNDDWQMGETYSSRFISCDPINMPVKPQEMTAVA